MFPKRVLVLVLLLVAVTSFVDSVEVVDFEDSTGKPDVDDERADRDESGNVSIKDLDLAKIESSSSDNSTNVNIRRWAPYPGPPQQQQQQQQQDQTPPNNPQQSYPFYPAQQQQQQQQQPPVVPQQSFPSQSFQPQPTSASNNPEFWNQEFWPFAAPATNAFPGLNLIFRASTKYGFLPLELRICHYSFVKNSFYPISV